MGPRPKRLKIEGPKRPRDERSVFVRFVCFETVEGQRTRLGLFQAIKLAEDNDSAPGWALAAIHELANWFDANLATPSHFERGGWKRPGQPALSWFKPQAVEHIRRMYELKTALEECGVHVDVLTTRDPGVIIWQDKDQLVAEPKGSRF
jgi:hypothetical protein